MGNQCEGEEKKNRGVKKGKRVGVLRGFEFFKVF
jgi:hypothetical protein